MITRRLRDKQARREPIMIEKFVIVTINNANNGDDIVFQRIFTQNLMAYIHFQK